MQFFCEVFYIKKFIVICFVVVFVFSVSVTALAYDSNGNEFINIDDYAKYTFSQDNTYVTCSMSFPKWWNVTTAYGYNWKPTIGVFKGSYVTFDTTENYLSLVLHPLDGRNLGASSSVGKQVQSAHFLSLDSFPKDTTISYSFSVHISDDVQPLSSTPYRLISYVDSNGVVVSSDVTALSFSALVDDSGCTLTLSDSFTLSLFDSNSSVAGFIPTYSIKNMEYIYGKTTEITLGEFTLSFPISSLQYESQQNEKLQDTMNSVENALEEQNKQFDDFVNTPAQPNESPIDGSVNDLDKAESELTEQTNKGFDQILEIVTGAVAEITAYATAFVAISGILELFLTLPILGPLIYVSLGLGIFALITNLVMSVGRAETAKSQKASKGGKKG